MAQTKTNLMIVGLVLVAGAGIAIHQWRTNRAPGLEPAASRDANRPVPAERVEARKVASPPAVAVTPVKAAPKALESSAATLAALTAPTGPKPADSLTPAQRNALEREITVRRYTGFFEKAGLSPPQREKMIQFLMDDREAGVDFALASARYGRDVSGNPEAFNGTVSELRAKIQEDIKLLLGEDGYAQFREADFAVRQEAVVERMQARLEADARLTDAQEEQMLAVLREMGVYNLNDEVVARAGAFLSPPQLAQLTAMQQRQKLGPKKEKVQQAIRENNAEAGPVPTGKP